MSRTQYQYSLDDPDGAELNAWAPRLVDALRARPELRDVSSDQQDQGLGTAVFIDRSTASRLGVSPQTIDDTLYDAFGQRQVSTMFTQLNQYRVVLEVKPHFRQNVRWAPRHLRARREQHAGRAAQRRDARGRDDGAAGHHPPGAVSGGDAVVQPGAGRGPGRGGDCDRGGDAAAGAAGEHPGQLPGHGAGLPGLAGQRAPADRGGPGGGLPRARRAVRELHPPADDSLHAALGRAWAPSWRCWSAAPS